MTDDLLARARAEAESLWELSQADALRSVSLADWNERVEAANGFILGVKWLLSQLPDREAVARRFFEWDTDEHPEPRPTWEGLSDAQRDVWRTGADAVLDLIRNGATK